MALWIYTRTTCVGLLLPCLLLPSLRGCDCEQEEAMRGSLYEPKRVFSFTSHRGGRRRQRQFLLARERPAPADMHVPPPGCVRPETTVMDRLHQAPTPLTIAGIASLQHEYYLAWVWPRATICEADVSGALKSAGGIGVPSTRP
jgi:hypothetical protein